MRAPTLSLSLSSVWLLSAGPGFSQSLPELNLFDYPTPAGVIEIAPDVRTIGVMPAPGASTATIIDKVQRILPLAAPSDLGGVILFSRANASAPPLPPLPDPPYPGFGARAVTGLLQWILGDDGWVSPAFYRTDGEESGPLFFDDVAYLQVGPELSEGEARLLLLDLGLGEVLPRGSYDPPGWYRVEVEDRHVLRALDRMEVLRTEPGVEGATLAFGTVVPGPVVLAEPPEQSAPQTTAVCSAAPLVAVGVYGDGIEAEHPNLSQPGGPDSGWRCTVNHAEDCQDGGAPEGTWDQHETTVSGVIAACGGSFGLPEGIANKESAVHSIKSMEQTSCSEARDIFMSELYFLKAMDVVEENGLRVVNISWDLGDLRDSIVVYNRLRDVRKNGHFVVSATGNAVLGFDPSVVAYPASNPYVMAIGALNFSLERRLLIRGESTDVCGDNVIDFQSRFGPEVAAAALGQDVLTTDRSGSDGYVEGDEVFVTGTSWASPLVAGAAARILHVNDELGPGTVEALLCRTAVDVASPGIDDETGCGRIDDATITEAEALAPHWIFADGFETSFEDLEVDWSSFLIESEQ